jgi:hypothetical protein
MRTICVVAFLSLVHFSQAVPYMILTSTRSKCLSVIAPQGQTITIEYDAPGKQHDFSVLEIHCFRVVDFHR